MKGTLGLKKLYFGFVFFFASASLIAASPGITDTTITIGMSSPFSGPNGAYGTAMRDTISAYFAQINKTGGINGRKLELVALDDGYEADRAVANTRTLIQANKSFALLAYYGSSPTTAAMEVFSAERVPLVGTISGADSLRTPVNRYMFNLRASYANETEAIVTQLVSLGVKRIAVFYQNDGFGKSGLDGVTSALKKVSLAPVAVGTIERNSLDVSPAVQTIAKADPQAVVMVTLYKPTAEFVRQMHRAGRTPQLMTLSPVGADMLVRELGAEARGIGISQVMPYPWDSSIPLVADYYHLVGKEAEKSYYGLEAFVMAKVLVEGLRKSGKTPSREQLVTALESMTSLDLGGFQVAFSGNNHAGSRFVDLTVVGPGGKILR